MKMELIYGVLYICSFFLLAYLVARTLGVSIKKNLFLSLLGLVLILFVVLSTFPSGSLAPVSDLLSEAIAWLSTISYDIYHGLMSAIAPEISEKLFTVSTALRSFYSCVLIFIIPLVYTLSEFLIRRIKLRLGDRGQELASGGLALLGGVTGAGLLSGVLLFLSRGLAANVDRLFGAFLFDQLALTMVIILSLVLSVVYSTATLSMINNEQKGYLNLTYVGLIALFMSYAILLLPFLAVSLLISIDLFIGFVAPAWPW